jgi:hypothetical protein
MPIVDEHRSADTVPTSWTIVEEPTAGNDKTEALLQ